MVEFKADMHNLYIRAPKGPAQKWVKLLFIATDDAIFVIMESWPSEWRAPDLAAMEKIATQQQKKDTKLHIAQLAERRRQEQEVDTQIKAAEAAVATQMAETTIVPTRELEEGQEMSTEQDI